MDIPWKELEKEANTHLTKAGKINRRSPDAHREAFVDKVREYIPWVQTIPETLWCITERQIEQPLCKYCGKPAYFKTSKRTFRDYCVDCTSRAIREKREATMIEKYGVPNASNLDSRQEVMDRVNKTRKERFASGEIQSWMKGKTKESDPRLKALFEQVSETKKAQFASGELEVWNKGKTKETDERLQQLADSMKASWIGREQSEAQKEVTKQFIEAGVTRVRTQEEFDKQKETNMARYGVPSYLSLVNAQGRLAVRKKYGSSYLGSGDWHSKKELYFEKMRQTNLERYGVENVLSCEEIQSKIQKSKRQNNTFSSSRTERESIKLLKVKVEEVFTQYKDDRYPFACDAYLPKYDLFIEFNYHWTHGLEPFIDSIEQKKVLEFWTSKAENSEFYENAITTWTDRDVNKSVFVETNNLNFIAFYSFEEFLEFYETIEPDIMSFEYYELEYKTDDNVRDKFKSFLTSYRSYNSRLKYNDLILPFVWTIFYKKELELWKDADIRKKLTQNRISYLNKTRDRLTDKDILQGFSRSMIHKGFSSFSPMIVKSFIRDFDVSSIYDPCGGWGHRLLGSWDIDYWYNDFNPALVEKIQEMHSYYNKIKSSGKKTFSCNDAASFVPNRKFDAVFTCPPYYDLEDYDFEGDSAKLVGSYEEWLESWWGNVILNAKQISDIFAFVTSTKYLEDMCYQLNKHGYEEIKKIRISESRKNHMSVNAEEYLTVWKLK